MWGIAIGATSFFVFFWIDAVALRRIEWVKPVIVLTTAVLFAWGLVLTLHDPSQIDIPRPLHALGWIFLVLFSAAMVYSLFIEIPFTTAYFRKGHPTLVISLGTYALCRHPGVLWFAGLMISIFLVSGSHRVLLAAPLWAGLNLLFSVLQERYFLVPMLGADYEAYRERVPMFIPTMSSARECARTLVRREGNE